MENWGTMLLTVVFKEILGKKNNKKQVFNKGLEIVSIGSCPVQNVQDHA